MMYQTTKFQVSISSEGGAMTVGKFTKPKGGLLLLGFSFIFTTATPNLGIFSDCYGNNSVSYGGPVRNSI